MSEYNCQEEHIDKLDFEGIKEIQTEALLRILRDRIRYYDMCAEDPNINKIWREQNKYYAEAMRHLHRDIKMQGTILKLYKSMLT
jgi:hypothetical protein